MPLTLDRPAELPVRKRHKVLAATLDRVMRYERRAAEPEKKRKAAFQLDAKQKKLIPVVAQLQENARPEVYAAFYVGLELAIAVTTTRLESSGRNIYGADPASSWMNDGPFEELWEHPVTKENFAWFWPHVVAGATSNGVGQKQLTSESLIAAANARGGAWLPEHNCAEGDVFFKELIAEAGSIWEAFYHYNGSGPAAERYANDAVAVVGEMRERGL
jgi:hypothetical protein